MQFDINEIAPMVHMLGEGGHIVRFEDVPAQNRAGHVIPSNLFHSLGRRTAGFEKLLKRRLVEARARSPRKHEFHGYTLLTHLTCGADVATYHATSLAQEAHQPIPQVLPGRQASSHRRVPELRNLLNETDE